ncbi:MAG: HutD/Ves family protein [Beijerinckiaceae bacterium]
MAVSKLERIEPSQFISVPWKNGGGTSLTIAQQHKDGAVAGDWSSLIWQLGRTAIVAPAPFSDLAGFDRMQVLVKGAGLVLQTPDADIDVRQPFQPVSFRGETPIVSRLENGPVEVVNLMAARDKVAIDLAVLPPDSSNTFHNGLHILYAPKGIVSLICDEEGVLLEENHAARIQGSATLEVMSGILLVATVINRS